MVKNFMENGLTKAEAKRLSLDELKEATMYNNEVSQFNAVLQQYLQTMLTVSAFLTAFILVPLSIDGKTFHHVCFQMKTSESLHLQK